jgi:crossover junction endodeoxyribonuclease RuvC
MIIVGVDPGLGGAIARFDTGTGALVDVVDMPILELAKAGKKSRIVDAYGLANLMARDCDHVFVETQQTRPGQAAQAVAKTFTGYGVVLGVVACFQIPISHVNPRKWKADLKVPAAKDGARARASELIRGGSVHWPLVKHDGRAEASLIGLWGMRSLNAPAEAAQ